MTQVPGGGHDSPSDAHLISRTRGGDQEAFGELFERHVEAARRLSRQLVGGPDADDLVSEAFVKVLTILQNGGGPDVAFRAYLLTVVRRLHVHRIRIQGRHRATGDESERDTGVPFRDTTVEAFESRAAALAFASLPERWQLVLWHLEVEGQQPGDISPHLGMTPNAMSALAYRAREGLRQAFSNAHQADIADSRCQSVTQQLGGYVRRGLSTSAQVESASVAGRATVAGHTATIPAVHAVPPVPTSAPSPPTSPPPPSPPGQPARPTTDLPLALGKLDETHVADGHRDHPAQRRLLGRRAARHARVHRQL